MNRESGRDTVSDRDGFDLFTIQDLTPVTRGGQHMRDPKEVSKDELRELLGKGWLTHDGAWFFSVASELGMESANSLNKAAIKAMAPFETRRTMKVLDVSPEDLRDFDVLMDFVSAGLGLIMPDSVLNSLSIERSGENAFRWEWEPGGCFAFKSMTQLGRAGEYDCGVLYRIECWIEAIGIQVQLNPKPEGCLMNETGTCTGEFIF